jgi:excisionase family DNA binding protein
MNGEELFTLAEVASRIRRSVSGVRGLIARGELIAVRHGPKRGVRVRRTDLEQYLASMPRYKGPQSMRQRYGLSDDGIGDCADRKVDS